MFFEDVVFFLLAESPSLNEICKMITPDPSNNIFQHAVSFVNQTNKHLFITGKAGTGKTTFLKYIRENSHKKMAVIAPTGVAAINAGGVTMHSFFQLPFGAFIPSLKNAFGTYSENINNPATLLNNLKLAGPKKSLIRELDLLIIDEVSMVRADLLDAIDIVLQHIRRKPGIPFGGVQMVYIGDLFQLPPVVKKEEWDMIKEYYESPFFFSALAIKKCQPLYIELKKIYRQNDDVFINILNNIRNNCCTESDLAILHKNFKPGFLPDEKDGYITLTSHNEKADAINQRELAKLPAKQHSFEATITGEFYERQFPAEKILCLKEGAQVMFIKNDKGDTRRYFNGKIGMIKAIRPGKVIIIFPGESIEIELEEEIWQNIRYNYDHEKDKVTEEEQGTFKQFPLRLAWAITIHKSQGLTFEKAIIDAGSSFAAGQVYVSLSRLTSLEGLVLYSRIFPDAISTDNRVIKFVNNELNEDRLTELLEQEKSAFINYSLTALFDYSKLAESVKDHLESYDHRMLPDKASCVSWAKELLKLIVDQEKFASTFRKQLETIFLTNDKNTNEHLHARVISASRYFTNQLDDGIMPLFKKQHDRMKSHKKIKGYLLSIHTLKLSFERKRSQILDSVILSQSFADKKDLDTLVRIIENKQPVKEVAIHIPERVKLSKQKKGDSGKVTLQMFRKGIDPAAIAGERGLSVSTIMSHLIDFVKTGEVEISEILDNEKLELIMKEYLVDKTQTATILKQKLPAEVSYDDIRAVRNYSDFKEMVFG